MSGARAARAAAAVIVGVLLVAWGIFLLRAELSWRRAAALMAEGRVGAAESSARGVFDLYIPGGPRLEDASRLLWRAAGDREAKGDRSGALTAYRALRSAWIGADPLEGDRGWIARTEARIARLVPGEGRAGTVEGTEGRSSAGQDALAAMRAPRRPHGPWGGVAALGFATWVIATTGFIAGGLRRDGRPRAVALGWAGLLIAGYAAWILGLMRA